jgi:glutamyl-tRNA reductase
MNLNFKAVYISYKNAPLAIREALALDAEACQRVLKKIKEILNIAEALVISTCNRTEIYYAADNVESDAIIKLLCIEKGAFDSLYAQETKPITDYFEQLHTHEEAVKRLFYVSLGLESQVVGDLQIINQAKQAYQYAANEGMAGAFLHRLMHAIFFTNKRIVQETSFKDGAASVSYATVEQIEELAANMILPRILLIGTGEIGIDVVRNLKDSKSKNIQPQNIFICNRTAEKAEKIAQECGFAVLPYQELWQGIAEADIIVSAVQRNTPLITVAELAKLNMLSFKYFIDLAVPRSIETEIEDLSGVLLYNIDSINNRADAALAKRKASIPHVEQIIAEALADFYDWSREMLVSPVIHKLKNTLEQIRTEEIARFTKQLDEVEMDKVDKITKNIMQKIIKLPVIQLKAACKRGEAETLIDILNDLFDLEKQKKNVE